MKVYLNMALVVVKRILVIADNAQAFLIFGDFCCELNRKAVIPPDFLLVCRYDVIVHQLSLPINCCNCIVGQVFKVTHC